MTRVALACACLGALLASACAPAEEDVQLTALGLPFALPIDCAQEPSDLAAEAWVSGFRDPEPLTVDLAAGTTTGEVSNVTVGDRTLIIDWYVERDFGGATHRVLLAQAETALDLTAPETATVEVSISPDDVEVAECRDVRGDPTLAGSATQTVGGVDVPACDLDDSCAGSPAPECANLGELCVGEDVFQ
jgi:hypothetical protein